MSGPHPSHETRFSDASTFDEVCVNCGAHDEVPGGWGKLAEPCPNAPNHDREYAKRQVGAGWHPLVEEAYRILTETGVPFWVRQVKEKWGALRIYWDLTTAIGVAESRAHRIAGEAILDLEAKSKTICEVCGKPGTLQTSELGLVKATCSPEHLMAHYE